MSTSKQHERLGYIALRVAKGDGVSIDDLKREFEVSERTARNDLTIISQLQPELNRGRIAQGDSFYCESQRSTDVSAKQDVASIAAREFNSGASIAASPGSTVAMTYQGILEKGIFCTVVTNSVFLTRLAARRRAPVFVVGGEYSPQIDGLLGDNAVKGFTDRDCRAGLVGVSGFSVTSEEDVILYVHDDAEVPVLRAMLDIVKETIVIVANIQKLGHGDPWQIGSVRGLGKPNGDRSRRVVVVTNRIEDWQNDLGNGLKAARETLKVLRKMHQDKIITLLEAKRQNQ
jgi:DeoR/GlpR family transcriptional regulator of sugar metabolism